MIARLLQTIRLGIFSLLLHKLRSALAVLGILIGITAVIWLVAMGEGVSYQAQQQIKDLGANNIIVRSVKPAEQTSTPRRQLLPRIRPAARRLRPHRLQHPADRTGRADARDQEGSALPGPHDRRAPRGLHARVPAPEPICDRSRPVPCPTTIGSRPTTSPCSARRRRGPCLPTRIRSARAFRSTAISTWSSAQTEERDPTAGIGGSLRSQDYNLDVYIPLSTLRARIGDMVITSRSGSREGEVVQLSQITVSVPDLEDVDETADIMRTLLDKYHPSQDYRGRRAQRTAAAGRAAADDVQPAAGADRRHLADRGRHRHHEYHARHGDRTDARNRHPPRAGGQAERHHPAVSGGSHRADGHRRCAGRPVRLPLRSDRLLSCGSWRYSYSPAP